MRPSFINEADITRWTTNISNDPLIKDLVNNPTIQEVCFATYWLWEELIKENCPDDIATRIQYTAGQISFGRDPWEVCQDLVLKFKNDELEYEDDENAIYN